MEHANIYYVCAFIRYSIKIDYELRFDGFVYLIIHHRIEDPVAKVLLQYSKCKDFLFDFNNICRFHIKLLGKRNNFPVRL